MSGDGCGTEWGRGGVYPGWGMGGYLGGLYRYPSQDHPRTHIYTIFSLRPYPRPNEGVSQLFDEVSKIGSRIDQN